MRQPHELIAAAGILIVTGSAVGADEPWVEAARTRQTAVTTLCADLQTTQHYAKRAEPQPKEAVMSAWPENLRIEYTNRVVIDGTKVRVEHNTPCWVPERSALEKHHLVIVHDGRTKAELNVFAPKNQEESGGSIESRRHDGSLPAAIALAVRGLEPGMSLIALEAAKATGKSLVIDGVACAEFTAPYRNETAKLWLDPDQHHVVRRMQLFLDDRVAYQLDVNYQQSPLGPIPSSWTIDEFNKEGTASRTTLVKVTNLRLNEAISPTEFELQFPAGCLLRDQRTGKVYRVQPDGSLREVAPNGSELKPEGPEPEQQRDPRLTWLVIGFGVVGLLLIAIPFLRRNRPLPPTDTAPTR